MLNRHLFRSTFWPRWRSLAIWDNGSDYARIGWMVFMTIYENRGGGRSELNCCWQYQSHFLSISLNNQWRLHLWLPYQGRYYFGDVVGVMKKKDMSSRLKPFLRIVTSSQAGQAMTWRQSLRELVLGLSGRQMFWRDRRVSSEKKKTLLHFRSRHFYNAVGLYYPPRPEVCTSR